MTKTMLIKILKWVPGSWYSARPPDFEELLGFGNSDFENLDCFETGDPPEGWGVRRTNFDIRISDLITVLNQ